MPLINYHSDISSKAADLNFDHLHSYFVYVRTNMSMHKL